MENPIQPKKLPKLKPKEREFVKTLVHKNDENATQTVKEVYDVNSDEYARLKAHRLITKDNVKLAIEAERESLKSALIKQGITPEYLAQKVNVLLTAVDKEGIQDYTAIDKGLKHATNIYGVEDPSDKPKENVYNFFFEPKFQQNIKNYDQHLKEQILNKDVEETENN